MYVMPHESAFSPKDAFAVMPRSYELGKAALELCRDVDRKLLSADAFIIAVHQSIRSIDAWSHGRTELIPEQLDVMRNLSNDELRQMQLKRRFSGVQVMGWCGEMKLQITALRRLDTPKV